MEKIDLNNYEAYFLDFMEGTLSAEEKHDLFAFLELHPALKAEMEEDFGAVELMPTEIIFDAKETLKIDENSLILTKNTVNDIMIASIEGQLSKAHNAELNTYVKANNLEKSFAYYKATILKPDTSIIYKEKQKLKVKTGVVISLPFITRIASIAAVGLILIAVAVNWGGAGVVDNNATNSAVFASHSKSNLPLQKLRFLKDANQKIDNVDEIVEPEIQNNYQPNRENNQIIEDFNQDVIAENDRIENGTENIDSTLTNPTDSIIPIDDPKGLTKDAIVIDEDDKDHENVIKEETENSDLAVAHVKTEEPYKIVTDMASNIIKREISYTRDKDKNTNEYVAYSFKLGSFEFERKKSK